MDEGLVVGFREEGQCLQGCGELVGCCTRRKVLLFVQAIFFKCGFYEPLPALSRCCRCYHRHGLVLADKPCWDMRE